MTANFAVTDGIAAIVLDDAARRNALGFDTLASIAQAVRQAEQAQAGAIVISATGPVFSAGADFNDLTGTSADIDFDTAVARATSALRRTHIPVIAAVHGPCLGAARSIRSEHDAVVIDVDEINVNVDRNRPPPARLLMLEQRPSRTDGEHLDDASTDRQ